jgi:hypothetical protein
MEGIAQHDSKCVLHLLTWALAVVLLLGPLPPCLVAQERGAADSGATLAPDAGSGDASVLLAPGTVSVSPSSSTVDVGGTVAVDVRISDTANLYGMDLCISFDSAILSVPSNDGALLWEVFDPAYHSVFSNDVSAASQTSCPCTLAPTDSCYHYLVINVNPAEPFAGSGRFARVTFQGLAPGTTALHFCYALGSDRDGSPLHPTVVDGSITVAGTTIPGDLDGDCDVDIVDIMLIAVRWGTHTGDAAYDARYDLDSDGDIDVTDIMTVAAHWSESCSGGPA